MKHLLWLLSTPALAWTLIGPSTGGWDTRHLTVFVNPTNCSVSSDFLNARLDAALAALNHVPTADITLTRYPDAVATTPADLSSGLSSDIPLIYCSTNFSAETGTEGDSVPASTMATSDGTMSYALLYLNSESGKEANIANIDSGKFEAMLAHELGHALGLGHSSQSEALMYFSIHYKPAAILTQDDMDGLTYLYPRNEFVYGPMGCANAQRPRGSSLWDLFRLLFTRSRIEWVR
ncbi:MAG: matrixin family metalloprotease [Deltaproteobacteria bacterium]|nr:matrixin family metalloprotease [Deltaproteobacteria bacterium]MBI3295116.1 matrixin family metalloprotease [Deltaproteobacteria bacterium]